MTSPQPLGNQSSLGLIPFMPEISKAYDFSNGEWLDARIARYIRQREYHGLVLECVNKSKIGLDQKHQTVRSSEYQDFILAYRCMMKIEEMVNTTKEKPISNRTEEELFNLQEEEYSKLSEFLRTRFCSEIDHSTVTSMIKCLNDHPPINQNESQKDDQRIANKRTLLFCAVQEEGEGREYDGIKEKIPHLSEGELDRPCFGRAPAILGNEKCLKVSQKLNETKTAIDCVLHINAKQLKTVDQCVHWGFQAFAAIASLTSLALCALGMKKARGYLQSRKEELIKPAPIKYRNLSESDSVETCDL